MVEKFSLLTQLCNSHNNMFLFMVRSLLETGTSQQKVMHHVIITQVQSQCSMQRPILMCISQWWSRLYRKTVFLHRKWEASLPRSGFNHGAFLNLWHKSTKQLPPNTTKLSGGNLGKKKENRGDRKEHCIFMIQFRNTDVDCLKKKNSVKTRFFSSMWSSFSSWIAFAEF